MDWKLQTGIHELHCDINAYEKNYFPSIFKWLCHENEAFQGQSSYIKNFSPSPTLSYTITKKPKRVFCGGKIIEGPGIPESPQGHGALYGP